MGALPDVVLSLGFVYDVFETKVAGELDAVSGLGIFPEVGFEEEVTLG